MAFDFIIRNLQERKKCCYDSQNFTRMSGLVIISLILSLADPSDTDCTTVPPPIPVSHTKIRSELRGRAVFPKPQETEFLL